MNKKNVYIFIYIYSAKNIVDIVFIYSLLLLNSINYKSLIINGLTSGPERTVKIMLKKLLALVRK